MAGLFINYRRKTEMKIAELVHAALSDAFAPNHQTYIDSQVIAAGDIIDSEVQRCIGDCDFLLVLIGQDWVTELNNRARRQIRDDVRKEIMQAAADDRITIIPILVDHAKFPEESDFLIDRWVSLVKLDQRLAFTLTQANFSQDVQSLIFYLRRKLYQRPLLQSATTRLAAGQSTKPSRSNQNQIDFVPVSGHLLRLLSDTVEKSEIELAPFEVSLTPLTYAQYENARRNCSNLPEPDTPRTIGWNHPDRPVVGLTHKQALQVAEALYCRLPTYNEWRCAAAELCSMPWKSGNSDAHDYGVFLSNSTFQTKPVGSRKPNSLQLLDMIGNVNTWLTLDTNGRDQSTESNENAFVGGSFKDRADSSILLPKTVYGDRSTNHIGIRLVRSLEG